MENPNRNTHGLSRRKLLAGIAAAGAALLFSSGRLTAQSGAGNPRAIDTHQHFASPAYIKALQAKDGHHVAGYTTWFALNTWKNYSPAHVIEDMDRDGVATGMLSCTTPGVWFGDPEETRGMAREMNEYAAKMASDYKGRFGLFALLPLPVIDDSLREIEYALDTLKADGVGLVSSYDDHWLGDPMFRPVFDELNRRKAIVYTHPIDAPCCQDIMAGVSPPTIEYNTDTARTIWSLIMGNDPAQNAGHALFRHPVLVVAWRRHDAFVGGAFRRRRTRQHRRQYRQTGGAELAAVPLAALLLRHGAIDQSRATAGAQDSWWAYRRSSSAATTHLARARGGI